MRMIDSIEFEWFTSFDLISSPSTFLLLLLNYWKDYYLFKYSVIHQNPRAGKQKLQKGMTGHKIDGSGIAANGLRCLERALRRETLLLLLLHYSNSKGDGFSKKKQRLRGVELVMPVLCLLFAFHREHLSPGIFDQLHFHAFSPHFIWST